MTKRQREQILNEFFSENLTEKQKVEFEQQASSDPLFLKEFIRRIELEEAFDDLLEQKKDKNSTQNYVNRKSVRILAISVTSAAVIFLAFFFLIIQPKGANLTGEELFSEYYKPFDLGITRSSPGKLSVAYLYHNYILEDFESLLDVSITDFDLETSDNLVYIILSIAAIENKQFEKATHLLNQVSKDGDHYLIASYYKALLLIKQDSFEEAIPYLEAIMDNSLIFRTESSKILGLFAENRIRKDSAPENF